MTARTKRWTAAQVVALGVRTDVPTAGEILAGLGRDESYRAVKRGTFPVPVLKVGRHLVVPTAPILELLGLNGGHGDRSPGADQRDHGPEAHAGQIPAHNGTAAGPRS